MLPVAVGRLRVLACGVCAVMAGASVVGRAQTDLPLLEATNFSYLGAFRLPAAASDQNSFEYGGTAMAFDADDQALWLVGHDWYQRAAEVTIPTPAQALTVDALPRAMLRRPFADILNGKLGSVGGDTDKIGGILPITASLIVSAYNYYDATGSQTASHFRVAGSTVTGPVRVGTAGAGVVAGYMTPVPAEWQSALGGSALTGQCCIPIISRTSLGPAASAFTPSDVGTRDPVPATQLLGYSLDHPTLGTYESSGQLYNGASSVAGVIFPAGTRSVLFVGRQSSTFCYGEATNDESLNQRPVPGTDTVYCYDPTSIYKGNHGYPYRYFVWAYDANDLAAVKNGRKRPWDILPYASWSFDLPFSSALQMISSVAYDPVAHRLFMAAPFQDGNAPLVHVLRVVVPSTAGSGKGRSNRPDTGEGYARPRPTDSASDGR